MNSKLSENIHSIYVQINYSSTIRHSVLQFPTHDSWYVNQKILTLGYTALSCFRSQTKDLNNTMYHTSMVYTTLSCFLSQSKEVNNTMYHTSMVYTALSCFLSQSKEVNNTMYHTAMVCTVLSCFFKEHMSQSILHSKPWNKGLVMDIVWYKFLTISFVRHKLISAGHSVRNTKNIYFKACTLMVFWVKLELSNVVFPNLVRARVKCIKLNRKDCTVVRWFPPWRVYSGAGFPELSTPLLQLLQLRDTIADLLPAQNKFK